MSESREYTTILFRSEQFLIRHVRVVRLVAAWQTVWEGNEKDEGPRISCVGRCLLARRLDSLTSMNAALRMSYFPVQHARRFSRNAEMPSWASAARAFMLITSFA